MSRAPIPVSNDTSSIGLCRDHPTLVAITAWWCGACEAVKPELAKLVSATDPAFHFVHFDTVDAATIGNFISLFHIPGYPTLLIYDPKSDKPRWLKYQGSRDAKDISVCMHNVNYCKTVDFEAAQPAVTLFDHDKLLAQALTTSYKQPILLLPSPLTEKEHEQKHDNDETTLKLCASGITVLAFSGKEWCPHCIRAEPTFRKWTQQTSADRGFEFQQFDDAAENKQHPEMLELFQIQTLPTMLLFDPLTNTFYKSKTNVPEKIGDDLSEMQKMPVSLAKWPTPPQEWIKISCETSTNGGGGGLLQAACGCAEARRSLDDTLADVFCNPTVLSAPCPDQRIYEEQGRGEEEQEADVMSLERLVKRMLGSQEQVFSRNRGLEGSTVVDLEMCGDCCGIMVFTGMEWCSPCQQLPPQLEVLKSQQGHGKFHLAHVDRPLQPSRSDVAKILCDTFHVQNFPTILVFDPHQKMFFEYTGPREARMLMTPNARQQYSTRPWPHESTNLRLTLTHQETHVTQLVVDVHAETNGIMELCARCPTVIVFALHRTQLQHLALSNGIDNLHVKHWNNKEHVVYQGLFQVNVFPTVLVFLPTHGLFYSYTGNCSDISFLRTAIAERKLKQVWHVHPRVVLKYQD